MRKLNGRERVRLAGTLLSYRGFEKRNPYRSWDETRAWQLENLKQLVHHAYETVRFYRELYEKAHFDPRDLRSWEDFERLPTVKKDDVIEHFPAGILSTRFDIDDLIVSRSSGSSGKVLDVAYSAETLIWYTLATLRIYRMGFAYNPWHRHVYVYTSPYPFNSILGAYPLHFVSTLEPIDRTLETLCRVRPQLIVCYPSHLRQISELASPSQLDRIRPLLISVSSELSSQSERDELARTFGCPTLDNYSSEELARIASQCPDGTYHVFEDMNVIETLDARGHPTDGLGMVVGTNLHNYATPLIRYEQNDFAALAPARCNCGRTFREMSQLEGRKNDQFTLPSGRVLTSGFLLDATYDFLLEHRGAIRDFCLIQEAGDRIRLEIVPGRTWSHSVATETRRRLLGHFGEPVDISVEEVACCEKTRTGKRNPIICRAGTAGAT